MNHEDIPNSPAIVLCAGVVALHVSRDVAALAMPNVDLETQEGRKMEGERAAIRKFFVLFPICPPLFQLVENQGESEGDICPLMLKVFPEKELKLCPEKLRS